MENAHVNANSQMNNDRLWPSFPQLGVGFYWAWTYLCFHSTVLFPWSENAVVGIRTSLLVSVLAHALTVLMIALLSPKIPTEKHFRDRLLLASSVLAVVGTLATALSQTIEFGGAGWLWIGAIATGIGTGWLVVAWGSFYGSLGSRRASACATMSALLAVAVYFTILVMPSLLRILLISALPLAAAGSLWLSRKGVGSVPIADEMPSSRFRLPWKLAAGGFIYMTVFAFARGFTDLPAGAEGLGVTGQLAVLIMGVVALLMGVGTFFYSKDLDLGFTYRPIVPLMIVGFLILPFTGLAGGGVLGRAIIDMSFMYLDLFFWIVLSDLAFRLRVPAIEIFSWGRLTLMAGPVFLGWLIGSQASAWIVLSDKEMIAFSLASVLVLVLSSMLILNERDVLGLWGKSPLPEPVSPEDKSVGPWRQRCARISQAYSLSPREEEIMVLLAKGRSLPFIKDELTISSGTVQTHINHIYRKLDVHSRQEMLNLIENFGKSPSVEMPKPGSPQARASQSVRHGGA